MLAQEPPGKLRAGLSIFLYFLAKSVTKVRIKVINAEWLDVLALNIENQGNSASKAHIALEHVLFILHLKSAISWNIVVR